MLIRSLSVPLEVANGGLAISTDAEVIEDAVYSVLMTILLERIMQPSLGVPNMVFDSYRSEAIVVERIMQALKREIPDVVFDIQSQSREDGTIALAVSFGNSDRPIFSVEL